MSGKLGMVLLFENFDAKLIAQVEFLVTLGATRSLFAFSSFTSQFTFIVNFSTFDCTSLPRDS